MLTAGVKHSREQIDLWRLAQRCGVKPAFIGSGLASLAPEARKQRASPDAVLAVLKSLGVPIDHPRQARDAMRDVEQAQWQGVIEPIIVHWQGESKPTATLRLTEEQRDLTFEVAITTEEGERRRWACSPADRVAVGSREVVGVRYSVVHLSLPDDLPRGYHTLELAIGSQQHVARLIVAPRCASAMQDQRAWGAFLPLYAVRTARDRGVGDLTDLYHLLDWTRRIGGSVVGTLPLLAAYFDEPCNPSPYAPVSRLFFNELYLDIDALGAAGSNTPSGSVHHVDYACAMAHKRSMLEPLAEAAFADAGMHDAIRHEMEIDDYLGEYARFRAVVERHGANWHHWPENRHERIRDDALSGEDADPAAIRYHLYVQYQLRRQLQRIDEIDRAPGRGLYLDLPVGVHSCGYDAWRFADCFAPGVSSGAPPDELFIGGQNWGFPPLHPYRSRMHGHEWFIQAIRRHLACAGLLRIDHVMWLHRMYWVPSGYPATNGVYVRNPAPDELYAVLAIESHRHRAAIVGENLGTVPDIVNRMMRRRGIYSLAVGQFMLTADAADPLPDAPSDAVASMNTHDTPTFAGFWNECDIDQRIATGLLDDARAAQQRARRAALRHAILSYVRSRDPEIDNAKIRDIVARLLERFAEGQAAVVMATLEDLWEEERPQNVPGTTSDQNWSRRATITMEEMFDAPAVIDALERIDRGRRRE